MARWSNQAARSDDARRRAVTGMVACAGFALSARASTSAAPGFTLAAWASDPLVTAALYHNPTQSVVQSIYPELPADGTGAEGQNLAFEAGTSPKWYVEEQRGGGDLVEAGVAQKDERLIDLGVKALQWGFARQNAAGGWDCKDTYHSATFFIAAAARAALCLRDAGLPKYRAVVDDWTPRLHKACVWMNRPEVLDSDPYFYQYTHRSYLAAAAFGEAAALTGDKAFAATAERLARDAVRFQWPDGVNPEKGGYDVGYQVAGLNFALRYYTVCADPDLRAAVARMIQKGMDFELSKMDAGGTVTTEGSTRLGHEINRSGKPKVIGYKPIFQAAVGTALLTGDAKYRNAATLIARGQGWLPRGA